MKLGLTPIVAAALLAVSACGNSTEPDDLIKGTWSGALTEGTLRVTLTRDTLGSVVGTGTLETGATTINIEAKGLVTHPNVIITFVRLPIMRDTISYFGEFDGDDLIRRLVGIGDLQRQ